MLILDPVIVHGNYSLVILSDYLSIIGFFIFWGSHLLEELRIEHLISLRKPEAAIVALSGWMLATPLACHREDLPTTSLSTI
jgi:hypothetical protein